MQKLISIVLIVDDDDVCRSMMNTILCRGGFSCTEASSAMEALERLDGIFLPDVIVTDLHLGEVSGRELFSILKSCPIYKSVPVVLVSSDRNVKEIAGDDNFAGVVEKSKIALQLADRVRSVCRFF